MSPDPLRIDNQTGNSYIDSVLDQYRYDPNQFPSLNFGGSTSGSYSPFGNSYEGPVIQMPARREEYIYATPERRSLGDVFTSGFITVGDYLNDASQYALDKMSDIGGWWKDLKGGYNSEVDLIGNSTGAAGSVDDVYKGYFLGAGMMINHSDKLKSIEEGIRRVPKVLDGRSALSTGLSHVAGAVDAATGILDTFEAVHDEEGKPGRKTLQAVFKSTAQIGLGAFAAQTVGAGVAGLGIGVAGAPLLLGTGALFVAGYGIGKAVDYFSGK